MVAVDVDDVGQLLGQALGSLEQPGVPPHQERAARAAIMPSSSSQGWTVGVTVAVAAVPART